MGLTFVSFYGVPPLVFPPHRTSTSTNGNHAQITHEVSSICRLRRHHSATERYQALAGIWKKKNLSNILSIQPSVDALCFLGNQSWIYKHYFIKSIAQRVSESESGRGCVCVCVSGWIGDESASAQKPFGCQRNRNQDEDLCFPSDERVANG